MNSNFTLAAEIMTGTEAWMAMHFSRGLVISFSGHQIQYAM